MPAVRATLGRSPTDFASAYVSTTEPGLYPCGGGGESVVSRSVGSRKKMTTHHHQEELPILKGILNGVVNYHNARRCSCSPPVVIREVAGLSAGFSVCVFVALVFVDVPALRIR